MKLLVYFARSGTDQDQQEDRQTEKTKKCHKEGEAGDIQEEDQAEESDTNREEDREEEIVIEEPAAQEVEENVEMARGDWPADSERKGRECCELSNCCNII